MNHLPFRAPLLSFRAPLSVILSEAKNLPHFNTTTPVPLITAPLDTPVPTLPLFIYAHARTRAHAREHTRPPTCARTRPHLHDLHPQRRRPCPRKHPVNISPHAHLRPPTPHSSGRPPCHSERSRRTYTPHPLLTTTCSPRPHVILSVVEEPTPRAPFSPPPVARAPMSF